MRTDTDSRQGTEKTRAAISSNEIQKKTRAANHRAQDKILSNDRRKQPVFKGAGQARARTNSPPREDLTRESEPQEQQRETQGSRPNRTAGGEPGHAPWAGPARRANTNMGAHAPIPQLP